VTKAWPALLGLLLAAAPGRADDFDQAYAMYKAWIKRPSLHKRTRARERLADTGDLRALKLLAQTYGRPEAPKLQVQYLLAFIAYDNFAGADAVPVYAEWRDRNRKPTDAWLWYLSLIPHQENRGAADLEAIVLGDENVFLRAAALETLRFRIDPGLLALIPKVVAKLPSETKDRAVMAESLAAALAALRDLRAKPEFRGPAEAVIKLMDEPRTLERTKIAMGRQFARLFGVKFVWRNGERWLAELDFAQRGGKQPKRDPRYAGQPTFAGIEGTGDRICYVIDMSDSMLTPLSPAELDKLPRGPITGKAAAVRREKEAKSQAWKRAFRAVKWDKVKNRFDAARELLKTSLVGLDENASFCVIWFGDKAGPLKSTRGLVKATAGNVQKTIRELDSIRPGPKGDNRPHGTLRGKTNLHGGLHRAFKLRGRGIVGPGEYVDLSTWDAGCDTIFVLSDGAASTCDWAENDRKDEWDRAGDPELGGRTNEDSDTLLFDGPYNRAHHLIAEVRRLNLFRKVEIHCVGMGEANMSTLRTIAALGKGEAISLRSGSR
jgi:hypothetical protein